MLRAKKSSKAADLARDAKLEERAAELAERLRDSEAVAAAQAKGHELASRTKDRIRDAHLDERIAELAARIGESERAQQAAERAKRVTDESLERLGDWLSHGRAAEKLHVQPAKRRLPTWLAALFGVAAGYAVAKLKSSPRGQAVRDEFSTAADRLTQETADVSAPPAEKPLEDKVRTQLGQDPRTSDLPKLNINVVEGTVFVRGSVPAGFSESTLRDVIAAVPGVSDVDLQVTASG